MYAQMPLNDLLEGVVASAIAGEGIRIDQGSKRVTAL